MSVLDQIREKESFCSKIGRVIMVNESYIYGSGLDVFIGETVRITAHLNKSDIFAEVVSIDQQKFVMLPLSPVQNIDLKSKIHSTGDVMRIPIGWHFLGHVCDAIGRPLDNQIEIPADEHLYRNLEPINPLKRSLIQQKILTGVKAIDLFTPLGKGQRIGIFAGSGVGKSSLLGMICQYTNADIVIVAMVGERGREVNEFLKHNIRHKKNTIVYVATADYPAVLRRQVAFTATLAAEWFRKQGKHVLLIMDSVTRFAFAQREIGLAAGEPMGHRGYPSSVFSVMPQLIERVGLIEGQGSITGIYTVLVEGDDHLEPISDHLRAILDGHIMLDRDLAEQGHFPSISPLSSVSRVANQLYSKTQQQTIRQLRLAMKSYQEAKDLISLGAYQAGNNPLLDRTIHHLDTLNDLLCQATSDHLSDHELWTLAQQLALSLKEKS